MMAWSAPTMVDGDDGDWRFPGELLQKGTPKFLLVLARLDALLLQGDLRGQAHRLSHAMGSGMTSIDGFFLDTGDRRWTIVRDMG
jgi:hypothetical protein